MEGTASTNNTTLKEFTVSTSAGGWCIGVDDVFFRAAIVRASSLDSFTTNGSITKVKSTTDGFRGTSETLSSSTFSSSERITIVNLWIFFTAESGRTAGSSSIGTSASRIRVLQMGSSWATSIIFATSLSSASFATFSRSTWVSSTRNNDTITSQDSSSWAVISGELTTVIGHYLFTAGIIGTASSSASASRVFLDHIISASIFGTINNNVGFAAKRFRTASSRTVNSTSSGLDVIASATISERGTSYSNSVAALLHSADTSNTTDSSSAGHTSWGSLILFSSTSTSSEGRTSNSITFTAKIFIASTASSRSGCRAVDLLRVQLEMEALTTRAEGFTSRDC
jgi:hypothetical protein